MERKTRNTHLYFHPFTFFFLLQFLCFFTNGLVQDFCVADVTLPETPSGYSCKQLSNVTVDDFVFSIGTTGNIIQPFKVGVVVGFAPQFPGVNGLGIAVARADILAGGVVPLHSHPIGTELLVVVKGRVVAGFISGAANVVYYKTLEENDTMVLPKGLMHFQVNVGEETAVLFSTYTSQNPGLQITSFALFQNGFPSELLEKTTLLDDVQVKKLKAAFGGTG